MPCCTQRGVKVQSPSGKERKRALQGCGVTRVALEARGVSLEPPSPTLSAGTVLGGGRGWGALGFGLCPPQQRAGQVSDTCAGSHSLPALSSASSRCSLPTWVLGCARDTVLAALCQASGRGDRGSLCPWTVEEGQSQDATWHLTTCKWTIMIVHTHGVHVDSV